MESIDTGVIDLATLENLPDPALIEILTRLDPKSLVNVCQSSPRIRSFCSYVWKSLFKRDITKKEVCYSPNWGKLYQIAVKVELHVYALYYGSDEYVVEAMSDIPEAIAIGKEFLKEEISIALEQELNFKYPEIEDFFEQNPDIVDRKVINLLDSYGEEFFIGVKFLGNMSAAEIMDASKDDYIVYTIKTPEKWQKSELEKEYGYDIIDVDVSRAILGLHNLEKELSQILRDKFNFDSDQIEEFFEDHEDELDDFKEGETGPYLQLEGDIVQTKEHYILNLTRENGVDTNISSLKRYLCSM